MNIKYLINKLLCFTHLKTSHFKSFTYYVPSPPQRNSSYREKHFDKVISALLNSGHQIISTKTIANCNPEHSGFWIHLILSDLGAKNADKDIDQIIENISISPNHDTLIDIEYDI